MRCAKLKSVTVVKLDSAFPAVWLHRKRTLRSFPEPFFGITEGRGMHITIRTNIGRNRYATSFYGVIRCTMSLLELGTFGRT
jgi:hypothetical protein